MKLKHILTSKKTIAFAMAGLVAFGSVAPAFAATPPAVDKTTTVNIEVSPVVVNMTVPTSADFAFNGDGQNTVPTNWTISNENDAVNMELKTINFTGSNSWQVAGANHSFANDEKAIKLKLGAEGNLKQVLPTGVSDTEAAATGTATFGQGDFVINKAGSNKMNFEVERATFTKAVSKAKAFDMTLNFDISQ